MAKGFSVWATLKGKDAASGPVVRGLGKIRVAGMQTGKVLRGALNLGGKALAFGGLGGIGGGLLGAGILTAAKHMVESQAELLHSDSEVAARMKMSIGTFQKWQYVAFRAAEMGGDEFRDSLKGLLPVLGSVHTGIGRGASIIATLSPSMTAALKKSKSPAESLGIILQGLGNKTKSYADRVFLANKIFGESGSKWVKVGELGKKGWGPMMAAAEKFGLNTKQGVKNVEAWEEANKDLDSSILGLKRTIGESLLKPLTQYTEVLAKWLTDHKADVAGWVDKAVGGFEKFVAYSPTIIQAIKDISGVLGPVASALETTANALRGITGSYKAEADEIGQDATGASKPEWERAVATVQAREVATPTGSETYTKPGMNGGGVFTRKVPLKPGSQAFRDQVQEEVNRGKFQQREFNRMSLSQILSGQSVVSGQIQVSVSDDRVAVRVVNPEGPVRIEADVGTPAVFR
jgi:hypothetical protein